jgi:methylated-DNA-[protein]-cysteine S-methyltransferase
MQAAVFPTALGWFGLVGEGTRVSRLVFGHSSAAQVRAALRRVGDECEAADWWPELRERLQAFAAGAADDFRDVEVESPRQTRFQQRVLRELRRVGHAQTVTYGELAARCGAPRAARAVGTVMAQNRVPIIVPCHRVVAAAGRLGGFSCPQGVGMKRRLLDLEASTASEPRS